MPERFQKTFISAREFLESWDKEIYETTNLDYFIFLMINHLGNQLERRFFLPRGADFRLKLDFDALGSLCFMLGDNFDAFLDENFESSDYRLSSRISDFADGNTESDEKRIAEREKRIRALAKDEMIFSGLVSPVDILHHSVLEALQQFYEEEKSIVFDDDDLDVIELAEFVVDEMVMFVRQELNSLLRKMNDSAMQHFESLITIDEDATNPNIWQADDIEAEDGEEWDSEVSFYEDPSQVIDRFIAENSKHSKFPLVKIRLFEDYLVEHARVNNIYDLSDEHIHEFLAAWLIKRFTEDEAPSFNVIYRVLASFLHWLDEQYDIDLKESFTSIYHSVKNDIPRLLNALNRYLQSYDLLEVMLKRDDDEIHQQSGFFELVASNHIAMKSCDLMNIQLGIRINNVLFDHEMLSFLKNGDILQATLIQEGNHWKVLEVHYVFPNAVKPLVY